MNLKRTLVATLTLVGLTATARHLYATHRANREFDELMADLALEEAMYDAELADYEYSAHYSVNDPVIVRNPYVADDWPEHGIIEKVARIQDTGAYTYKVTGQDGWINENWLVYDDYGPLKLLVFPVKLDAKKPRYDTEINYWLETRKQALRDEDDVAFAEAESELTKIAVKMSGVVAND